MQYYLVLIFEQIQSINNFMLIPMRSNIRCYIMQRSHECWEGDTGNTQAHAAEVETVYMVEREGR